MNHKPKMLVKILKFTNLNLNTEKFGNKWSKLTLSQNFLIRIYQLNVTYFHILDCISKNSHNLHLQC